MNKDNIDTSDKDGENLNIKEKQSSWFRQY